jgi:type I restriction enzyme M protein
MSDRRIQETISFIWDVANLIRDTFKRGEYADVILPFTVLRRVDCVIRPTQEAVRKQYLELHGKIDNIDPILRKTSGVAFYNTSKFNFDRLLEDHANIYSNFMAYYNAFSDEMRGEVLDNFKFRAVIEDLNKNDLLYMVVERFSNAPHLGELSNHDMGYVFEELIRRFNEANNENPGEHFTPREVIRLMVDLMLVTEDEKLRKSNIISSIYDPCCGTGGMLTIAKQRILEANPTADIHLFGQELNQKTYAVTKSDMLMMNPDGVDAARIKQGSSLSKDEFRNERFHYLIANPPYGKNWDMDKKFVTSEHAEGERGRFAPGLPRSSDGQMLFMLSMLSKMRSVEKGGSRVAIVMNGSPLFTGDANGGESEIRRYIFENDLLETLVAVPEQVFYNTGIATYVWILTNRKSEGRKGKVQLIDASGEGFWKPMRKSLGSKRREMDESHIAKVLDTYGAFEEDTDVSKVYPNSHFGYRKVTVYRPLQLNVQTSAERMQLLDNEKQFTKLEEDDQAAYRGMLEALPDKLYMSRDEFVGDLTAEAKSRGLKVAAPLKKAIINALGERDADAEACKNAKGIPEADTTIRDTERVPLDVEIDDYMEIEVLPHVPDAWVNTTKSGCDKTTGDVGKIGYEINFNRYFYVYTPPRPLEEIEGEIIGLQREINDLMGKLFD